jgi:outer membrane protein TolC
VGLGLNAPLDFWNLKSIHDGAQASQRAAEMEYQRKVFDQEREWADLSNQFQSKKEELQLAREVEKVQREKLAYEQDRLKKGRTTTFQVLIFEQDFATARLNLILSETQLLNLRAQMKTFGDSSL